VEVVGGRVSRTQVNRRKAFPAGELVFDSEALFPFVAGRVVAAGYDVMSMVLTQGSPVGSRENGYSEVTNDQ
jgi:hypothetical protein